MRSLLTSSIPRMPSTTIFRSDRPYYRYISVDTAYAIILINNFAKFVWRQFEIPSETRLLSTGSFQLSGGRFHPLLPLAGTASINFKAEVGSIHDRHDQASIAAVFLSAEQCKYRCITPTTHRSMVCNIRQNLCSKNHKSSEKSFSRKLSVPSHRISTSSTLLHHRKYGNNDLQSLLLVRRERTSLFNFLLSSK